MPIKIPSNYRLGIRAKQACEIAGINPDRFNMMVHAGHYDCAPRTIPGSVRIFNLDQTVALKIFGDLLFLNVSPEQAGQIACEAYKRFAGRKEPEHIICGPNDDGEWVLEKEGPVQRGETRRSSQLIFFISEIREQLEDHFVWVGQGRFDDTP